MSKIEWTEKSWNPVSGCSKVSTGCKFCYAETIAKRFWKDRKFTDVQFHEDRLDLPLKWKKPYMIFVNSMSDLFHEKIDFYHINKIMLTVFKCYKHTFQVLTKRPERAYEYFIKSCKKEFPFYITNLSNLWLGVSVENQETADLRIPILLQIPVEVKWLSIEPLLSEVDIKGIFDLLDYKEQAKPNETECSCGICRYNRGIQWVVIGCESGHNRRPCKIEWVEKIVEDCKNANVPVFVKQLNINGKVVKDIEKFPKHLQVREYPN